MKAPHFFWLALCLAAPLHAQQSAPPASPLPVPSPPYVKSPPASSQWLITYTQGEASAKPSSRPPVPEGRAGLAKRTTVVTKTPGILSETTALQNGSVTRRICTPALSVTLLSGTSEWLPATNVQNGFNETDYSKNEFAGFDWLSQKNYVGVQEVAKRPCFVFHDKVVTADPAELDLIRTSLGNTSRRWLAAKEKREADASGAAPAIRAPNPGERKSSAATPSPSPEGSPPPGFNLDDYQQEATAYIDVETGLPTLLTYRTPDRRVETRTYSFMPPPTTPLTLPPEAQAIFDNRQAHLKRLMSPAGAP